MTSETPDVGLSSGELGDLAAAYGWWNAHGDPEAFYDVLDAAVQRILAAAVAAHARDLATLRERAEVAEAKVAAVEALHQPDPTGDWCDHCWTGPDAHGNGPSPEWPCATARALADRPAGGES